MSEAPEFEWEYEMRPEGVVLAITAQPGSRRNEVRGVQDGALKVCVTQVAEKGKANKAIIEQLAKSLGVRKSRLELLVGATASRKKILVRDMTTEELRDRTAGLLETAKRSEN